MKLNLLTDENIDQQVVNLLPLQASRRFSGTKAFASVARPAREPAGTRLLAQRRRIRVAEQGLPVGRLRRAGTLATRATP